jgi:hypothetical protein
MDAAPPKISRFSSAGNVFAGIVLGVVVLGGGAMIFFFNPATHTFYPVCWFHQSTGLNCPGCGATRALYALLHGEWRTALRDNALFVAGMIALAMRGSWFAANRLRGRRNGEFFPAQWLWPLLALALVFTVLRNLSAFAFLSPETF